MTNLQIDFHVLAATQSQAAFLYACKLIETAHQQQKRIFIQTDSLPDAERLDALLWTYKDDSFLPHELYTADSQTAIHIGTPTTPSHTYDILINLSREVPTFYLHVNHLIEIVFSDPIMQQLARDRYKHYRDQGYLINTIKIK